MVAAEVEADLEGLRQQAGFAVDTTLLRPFSADSLIPSAEMVDRPAGSELVAPVAKVDDHGPKLGEVYDRYMADPTQAWTPSTRRAYDMTRRLVLGIIEPATPVSTLTRTHARDLIDILRQLPRNSGKRFPWLSPRDAVERTTKRPDVPRMSAANVNAYLGNFSTFMNWAVNEDYLDRNPARGLRLPDDVAKRDKRFPFSAEQLRLIFNAPLFTGCVDGGRNYAAVGPNRPKNARYWVPLIGLHTGMRLNEICQLDVTDVRVVDGVACICVSLTSLCGSTDKRLKTGSSDRLIPLHPTLLDLGLVAYAEEKRRAGETKLFAEIEPGPSGIRAVAFSKWFTQFLDAAGARRERTSYHSFRHNFRDELRVARIDYDVAMALGGWASKSSGLASASEAYGSGYRVEVLRDAIKRLVMADVDLSHLRR